jgi:flagellar biosynthesis/type III secretory pathway chaperone
MDSLTELSNILWRQRRALEQLLYKLEVQQLVLASGRTRWLGVAAEDTERVLQQMRDTELRRAIHAGIVATQLGLSDVEPTLNQLIVAAPAPWDSILREHQDAFMTMTAEVDELTRANTELLTKGYHATRDFLAALQGTAAVDGYSAAGRAQTFNSKTHLVDTAF